jgi:hypothetical protein
MKNVDVVIISWAKNDELLKVTTDGLDSLFQSDLDDIAFHAYVVESNYESLYEHHKKCLLMDNPEDFLINNLERVTGNFEFSKMAVQSYLIKNDYQTPLKGLTELITWKDVSLKNEYLDFFIFKYKNIVKVIDGEYMTNFEGLNKFLLNLEVKYLDQWLIKEQINELYYQITHELINSYEILYKERALYA